ncbi:MAG: family 43 glycosylhydrolase [Liquorilactobacillus ghanensis]|uniref:family 43 glycosylhydrolase n=1 Tax=Liquorilactobacillus ghanensis TaxID=399370 RepID=UPI0039E86B65
MKEYCNPLNIEYKFQHYGSTAHREAADPTLVYFKKKYYMFASMSAGFYYSNDLVSWKWHENRKLDIYRYAPDVRQIGEYLYFCASDNAEPSTIWRSKTPLSDDFEKISEPFAFWDPDLFYDDDSRIYLYWGCSNKEPIYGIELDKEKMMPIGEKVELIHGDINNHGWERLNYPGKEVEKGKRTKVQPFIEGAYINKWNGKYYLQYAAPGTELPVYGDGVYVSEAPLGPYTFMVNTPFSFKPSGFITGAGHGSTIEDEYGNLWHAATMRISVNKNFERRVGLFPAGIDKDGLLYCNQNFADYPIVIPDGKFDPRLLAPHYMLLSYKKDAEASSVYDKHNVSLALDENIRTWWCAQGSQGEWYKLDLGKIYTPHSIQLNLAEEGIPVEKHSSEESAPLRAGKRYIDSKSNIKTRYLMEGSKNGEDWFIIHDASEVNSDLTHDYIILNGKKELRYVKVTAVSMAYNAKFAISGLRVFGLDDKDKPERVMESTVAHTDGMTAKAVWKKAKGAIGYNLRYGIAPDKLYTSYQVYGIENLLLTALNKNQKYWYCIDSFNESGITEGVVNKIK